MADLEVSSRYIYIDRPPCTGCGRITDRRILCSSSPAHCPEGYCWRCWVNQLERAFGDVCCARCGSTYGGRMSPFDCGEFQSLWVAKFGYRSWQEAEADNPGPAPDPSKRRT